MNVSLRASYNFGRLFLYGFSSLGHTRLICSSYIWRYYHYHLLSMYPSTLDIPVRENTLIYIWHLFIIDIYLLLNPDLTNSYIINMSFYISIESSIRGNSSFRFFYLIYHNLSLFCDLMLYFPIGLVVWSKMVPICLIYRSMYSAVFLRSFPIMLFLW